ncbi:MAG: SURF1 family protein [Nocardioidaceae bacterium]
MVRALFSPRMLVLHALAIVVVLATVLLGRWQYGAWQSNRQDRAEQQAHTAAKPLESVLGPDAAFPADAVGQPVRLEGHWLNADTLFVENKHLSGRSGYWVVTPVLVCPRACRGASAILVVRGFSSAASAPVVGGPVTVTGWLQPGETGAAVDPHPHDDVLAQLRIADAISHVKQDLYGGYVIARNAGRGMSGLTALTPAVLPKPGSFTAVRNLLYGLQWWLFGVFAVFVWWRWCRDEMARVASEA